MTKHPFEWQKPTEEQAKTIADVRLAYKVLYEALLTFVPAGRERALAITKLQESGMWSNAAIVMEEPNG